MPNQRPEPLPQFTLARLFWLAPLCTPVMVVGRAEWNTTFPLLTILTVYAVSIAINLIFFGNPFSSLPQFLAVSIILLMTGLIAFGLSLGWLCVFTAIVASWTGLRAPPGFDFSVVSGIGIWTSATIAVAAGNMLLVLHRRYVYRAPLDYEFPRNKLGDNARGEEF